MLAGTVMAGWQMARALLAAERLLAAGQAAEFGHDFLSTKITVSRFYADHLLTRIPGQRDAIVEGAQCVTELAAEDF